MIIGSLTVTFKRWTTLLLSVQVAKPPLCVFITESTLCEHQLKTYLACFYHLSANLTGVGNNFFLVEFHSLK